MVARNPFRAYMANGKSNHESIVESQYSPRFSKIPDAAHKCSSRLGRSLFFIAIAGLETKIDSLLDSGVLLPVACVLPCRLEIPLQKPV
jgi:hypothetical protein